MSRSLAVLLGSVWPYSLRSLSDSAAMPSQAIGVLLPHLLRHRRCVSRLSSSLFSTDALMAYSRALSLLMETPSSSRTRSVKYSKAFSSYFNACSCSLIFFSGSPYLDMNFSL